jgi:hypothetical protein
MNRSKVHLYLATLMITSIWAINLEQIQAQTRADPNSFGGLWELNEKMSDSTDKAVEKALRAMGQKVKRRWFSANKEQFRGGPAEQELYDRISYDRTLSISVTDSLLTILYAGEYTRTVYLDGRSRSVSLGNLDNLQDFSFGHPETNSLIIEARPKDGGSSLESWRLLNQGEQLEITVALQPRGFTTEVEIIRVFDRR